MFPTNNSPTFSQFYFHITNLLTQIFEIMKNLLLFCAFFANALFVNAQQNNSECATLDPTTPDPPGVYSYSTSPSTLINCVPKVFNIKFWGIMHPDGNDYNPTRAHDVLEGIANLNILYNQFGIYFKYRGYEEIESPALPNDSNGYYVLENTLQYGEMLNWAATNGYKDENAFNVYAFGWATGFGGIASYQSLTCGVASHELTSPILTHEIGHNLNLRHTNSISEHATRDPNDPCFNATTAGDLVVDTNANRGFDATNTDPNTCTYIGDEEDSCTFGSTEYYITHEDIINTMGKRVGLCGGNHYFSMGQGIRMREAIAAGHYNAALTDLASLYEPYSGGYYQGGPSMPTLPLFQPGFNYKFYECSCDCPLPSDYNDISFSYTNHVVLSIDKYETNYNLITHPNHTAIYIDIPMCEATRVRRCYDNDNINPKSGSVIRFNDGVINGNVTITPKDSIGINNPVLIDELNPGLYNIKKDYYDGSTEENVIFKEN